jgi:hypothetical protein
LFDEDGSGTIDVMEIKRTMLAYGQKVCLPFYLFIKRQKKKRHLQKKERDTSKNKEENATDSWLVSVWNIHE